jgi:hypothetical protein
MDGWKLRVTRTLLAAAGLALAAMLTRGPYAVALFALACLTATIEFGHEAVTFRRARRLRAQWEKEQAELTWALVPGPGA